MVSSTGLNHLISFYKKVQVHFGQNRKITVVHKHSSIGIYKKESSPLFIVDNEEDFAKILDKILSYGVDRKLYQEQAKRYIDDDDDWE